MKSERGRDVLMAAGSAFSSSSSSSRVKVVAGDGRG